MLEWAAFTLNDVHELGRVGVGREEEPVPPYHMPEEGRASAGELLVVLVPELGVPGLSLDPPGGLEDVQFLEAALAPEPDRVPLLPPQHPRGLAWKLEWLLGDLAEAAVDEQQKH